MQLQPAASVQRLLHPAPLHAQDCDRVCACRERNDGLYRPSTYLLFKMVEEMTVFFFLSLVTTSIVFAPCRLGGSFLLFWLVNFITTATGIGERPCSPCPLTASKQWALPQQHTFLPGQHKSFLGHLTGSAEMRPLPA